MSTPGEDLRNEIDRLHKAAGGSSERRSDFTEAQSRAAPCYDAYGQETPSALQAEGLQDYRIRLLSPFKQHSTKYKDADLSMVSDEAVFSSVENSIFKDAVRSRTRSDSYRPGELVPSFQRDGAGRAITRWNGDPMAAWNAFTPPARYAKFLVPAR